MMRRFASSLSSAKAERTGKLRTLIEQNFPRCDCAIGYGSGVKPQLGYSDSDDEKPMVDFILVVSDAVAWHAQNLKVNSHHYSAASWLGEHVVACLQRWGTARMYYNPYATVQDELCKYGVIETRHFHDDLRTWSSLFAAGRMHKPVVPLVGERNVFVDAPEQRSNLAAAIHVAALRSARVSFDEEQLYTGVAALSYVGDPRMELGVENPHKVRNIVRGSFEDFQRLYRPVIDASPFLHAADERYERIEWRVDDGGQTELVASLPSNLVAQLGGVGAAANVLRAAEPAQTADALTASIRQILRSATTVQHAKGVISAGISPAIRYLHAKWKKGHK
jgi:mitochondrial translocator assembly and maintenance protein 41